MCAGTPTTFSSCRAVSGVMALSPLNTALSFAAGRRMRRARSSLLMSSSAITSSRYSPGGIARSEWMVPSVVIVLAHLIDHRDLKSIALQREDQPMEAGQAQRPLAHSIPLEWMALQGGQMSELLDVCLLYTSDAADDLLCV